METAERSPLSLSPHAQHVSYRAFKVGPQGGFLTLSVDSHEWLKIKQLTGRGSDQTSHHIVSQIWELIVARVQGSS